MSDSPMPNKPLSATDLMMQMAMSAPPPAPDRPAAAATVAERQERIAAGLRGNKKMLSGLDTEARAVLGQWTDAAAAHIAAATDGLSDADAEDIIQTRTRAMRRAIYGLKDVILVVGPITPEQIAGLCAQAAKAYGPDFRRPAENDTGAFCERWNGAKESQAERLAAARRLVEPA